MTSSSSDGAPHTLPQGESSESSESLPPSPEPPMGSRSCSVEWRVAIPVEANRQRVNMTAKQQLPSNAFPARDSIN
eukprot:3100567-Alexandrium_andersonii.AAC.1